jgi:hypothetical protein
MYSRLVDVTDLDNAPTGSRYSEVEDALTRIPSVTAVRIVPGTGDRIAEVHVLARRDRAPKQLVRDVQSVALASFGLEVDYRTVSVVQLDDPVVEGQLEGKPAGAPRPELLRITSEVASTYVEIRVHIGSEGEELVGSARGPASGGVGLVARAVIQAIEPLLNGAGVDIEHADIVLTGVHNVALVVIRLVSPRSDQVVSGSAIVRRDPNDAMARAALAAVNRLLVASA